MVLQRAYPYANVSKVPMKYDAVHVEIAAYMINKRGAEGEVSHSENGVSRTYEDGDMDEPDEKTGNVEWVTSW